MNMNTSLTNEQKVIHLADYTLLTNEKLAFLQQYLDRGILSILIIFLVGGFDGGPDGGEPMIQVNNLIVGAFEKSKALPFSERLKGGRRRAT